MLRSLMAPCSPCGTPPLRSTSLQGAVRNCSAAPKPSCLNLLCVSIAVTDITGFVQTYSNSFDIIAATVHRLDISYNINDLQIHVTDPFAKGGPTVAVTTSGSLHSGAAVTNTQYSTLRVEYNCTGVDGWSWVQVDSASTGPAYITETSNSAANPMPPPLPQPLTASAPWLPKVSAYFFCAFIVTAQSLHCILLFSFAHGHENSKAAEASAQALAGGKPAAPRRA